MIKKEKVIIVSLLVTAILGVMLIGNGINGMVINEQSSIKECPQGLDCNSPEISGFIVAAKSSESELNKLYSLQIGM